MHTDQIGKRSNCKFDNKHRVQHVFWDKHNPVQCKMG